MQGLSKYYTGSTTTLGKKSLLKGERKIRECSKYFIHYFHLFMSSSVRGQDELNPAL